MAPRKRTFAAASKEKEEVVLSNGITIKEPTSESARKRRRPGIGMLDLLGYSRGRNGFNTKNDKSNDDDQCVDYAAEFGAESVAHYTWGSPNGRPILAVERKRRIGLSRLKKGMFSKNSNMVQFIMKTGKFVVDDYDFTGDRHRRLPNGPERSHLLRLPLEIRQQIYEYLLVRGKEVVINCDLKQVQAVERRENSIIRVCKQIAFESTEYLYGKNVFRAMMRPNEPQSSWIPDMSTYIQPKFLGFLRKVIIDFAKVNYDAEAHERAVGAIDKLIKAGAVLDTLTFIITPRRLLRSLSVLPHLPIECVSFADFFASKSKLMQRVQRLPCRHLNLLLKINKKEGSVRVMLSIDLQPLAMNKKEDDWFGKDVLVQRNKKNKRVGARLKLRDLRQTIEEMVDNHEKAIMEGKGRLQEKDETMNETMLMAIRG